MKFKITDNNGFTLVELLASVMVFIAVGAVTTGIITSSLRGANKTNTVENIRQNGNFILKQMSKNIEYAQIFDGVKSNVEDAYNSSCFYPSPTPAPDVKFIKITSADGNPTIYNCDDGTLTIASDAVTDPVPTPLIDGVESFSLEGCTITCTQVKSTDIPIVGISFSLKPKNPGLVENSSPPIDFQTSVAIRNYKK